VKGVRRKEMMLTKILEMKRKRFSNPKLKGTNLIT